MKRFIEWFNSKSKKVQFGLGAAMVFVGLSVIAALVPSNEPASKPVTKSTVASSNEKVADRKAEQRAKSQEKQEFNIRTREYMDRANSCLIAAQANLEDASNASSLVEASASLALGVRVCERNLDILIGLNTDGFSDEATRVWNGVFLVKSGLNAFRAYLDTAEASKAVEAQEKVRAGTTQAYVGFVGINVTRTERNLKAYNPPS